jgi:hypothetical protein
MRLRPVVLAVITMTACATPLRAEVLGPLLPRNAVEIGLTARDTDRTLEYAAQEFRFTQSELPATIRFGLSTTATLSFELDANPFDTEDAFYTVGASIQALIWREGVNAITVTASYARTYALDVRASDNAWDEQRLDWSLLGQRSLDVWNQEATAWLGPMVSYVYATPRSTPNESWESSDLLGGAAGAELLFVDHILLQGALVWIDEPEYRVTLGYRF